MATAPCAPGVTEREGGERGGLLSGRKIDGAGRGEDKLDFAKCSFVLSAKKWFYSKVYVRENNYTRA